MNTSTISLRERLASSTAAPRPVAQRGPIDNRAYHQLKARIHESLLDRVDLESMQRLSADQVRQELRLLVERLLEEEMVVINDAERKTLTRDIQNEMLGFGPLATGIAFLPFTLGIFGMSRITPWLIARVGARAMLLAATSGLVVAYAWLSGAGTDGTYLGKHRKNHIPQVKGFWEKFYFKPGNLGYPVFDTAVGKVGVYICYDRHFPEGWHILGLGGAEIVFNPSATHRGLSEYLWRLEQPAAAVANMYYVGAINRVGIESDYGDDDFYGQSYFVNPRGQFVGDVGSAHAEELIVRDLDLDLITEVRNTWQFYRDRRPDAYADLTRP